MAGRESGGLRDSPVPLVLSLVLYLSVLIRMLLRSPQEGVVGPLSYGLMAVVLALGVIAVPIHPRWPASTHLYLVLQSVGILALFLTEPSIDYYGILFVALSITAARDLRPPWDIAWLGILCVGVTLGMVVGLSPGEALAYLPTYIAGCLLLGLYGRAIRRAEEARAHSDALRSELEKANRWLRALAQEAEEAAATQERARLSRELHDAATQTVFSMSLTAAAARAALAEDPPAAVPLVERLEVLARDALSELRSLVHELRPQGVAELGLARALERHASMRGRRDGLAVTLSVEGEEQGPLPAREALFSTAVEALNNVVKHAGVCAATVSVSFGTAETVLRVRDEGRGFDPGAPSPESLGLLAMRERVEALPGTLEVRTAPGRGTTVEARVPIIEAEAP
jgi:signal transduction histidine kinase